MSAVVWAVLVLALVSVGLIACGVAVALDVQDAVKEMEGGQCTNTVSVAETATVGRSEMENRRHPIPPKRRKRQRVGWLALGMAVLGALALAAAPTVEREPVATSQPYYIIVTPAPSPTPTVWVRYSIALDDAIQRYITSQAEAREIDPALVMAIIQEESQCDPLAIGDGGKSWGLMQIQPSAHQERIDRLGVTDLLDACQNVDVGIDYLAELSGKGNGLAWTIMAYNGGESYADRMTASGQVSNYAIEVMELYEAIAESTQVMVADEQP